MILGSNGDLKTQLPESASMPVALSVVVPAFNEALRLPRTLEATTRYLESRGALYEILIVDDGSTDATVRVAEEWGAAHPLRLGTVQALRYDRNHGKGYAVRFGVLRATGALVLYMDADLATPIKEMEKLEAALPSSGEIQVAIGSRPLASSQLLVRQPWYRELAGRAFNGLVQIAATPGIQDTQCGFKLMTATAARVIFSRCTLEGFSFDVEALLLARKLGFGIAEVPVRWAHQEGAAAFATPGAYLRHGLRMIGELTRIRWTHRAVRRLPAPSAASTAPAPPL
jgi:dolichyl-phosphate beta-glucosyltransferase